MSNIAKFEIEVYDNNTIDTNKINDGKADYNDLMASFSRELSMDEIALISGASKTGTNYAGGTLYV